MMWTIPTPWGPISFHFCMDEARMMFYSLLAMLPFVGGTWLWVRSKLKKHAKDEVKSHHACCHPEDDHGHD
jgi:hypothetical protein